MFSEEQGTKKKGGGGGGDEHIAQLVASPQNNKGGDGAVRGVRVPSNRASLRSSQVSSEEDEDGNKGSWVVCEVLDIMTEAKMYTIFHTLEDGINDLVTKLPFDSLLLRPVLFYEFLDCCDSKIAYTSGYDLDQDQRPSV